MMLMVRWPAPPRLRPPETARRRAEERKRGEGRERGDRFVFEEGEGSGFC